MKITSTYSVKLNNKDVSHVLKDTVAIYRNAVDFYIGVINREWDAVFSVITTQKSAVNAAEALTVSTAKRPVVKYRFGAVFYKFPSYLRRACIAEAYGKVSSYRSNLSNWENSDPRTRGLEPGIPKAGYVYPAMYRDNCYVRVDTYTARIKAFVRNTWDWISVRLRKRDVDYILHHCQKRKECVPTLQKRGKCWYLDFPFQKDCELNNTDIFDQTIVAVDLGINSCCACAVMRSDGTIVGRSFLKLPKEYDSLNRKISHIKYAQRHGSRCVRRLWKFADGVNDDIAVKTAQFIIDTAVLYNADTIVFEHLDLNGKKHGSKRQRLHLWKAKRVQSVVTDKAHMLSMRISRINAWNTSRLAFDGSGRILRGRESAKTNGNYSLCEFSTGKVYNCDLNASYNIGSRYFVREILKSLPVTDGQRIRAKVPGCAKRSTCTLSTLISLDAELYAAA
ncbi:MAG: transposase [Lachnospiraceae bacterium]|jgi:IS605 OrfB family transposase|nr:transposase [Lachnospiraceae bacterium]MCH4107891.1 transposase [Lachnospiraceae bacterium]